MPPGHPNYNPSHPSTGPNRLQPGQPGAPGQAKIGASFNPFSELSGDSNFVPANLSDLRHGLSGVCGGSAGQDMSLKGLLGVHRAASIGGGQLHASSPLMQASLSFQQSEQLHLLHQQQHMELQKQQQLQKNQLIQQQKMIQKMYYEASQRQQAYNATHNANSTKTSTSTSPSFPTQSKSVIDLSAVESDEDDKRDLALLGVPGSDGLRRTNGFDDESLSKPLDTVPTGGLDGLLSAYGAPLLPSLRPDSTVHSDYYTAVEAVYQNKSGSSMSNYTAATATANTTSSSSSSSSSGVSSSEAVKKSAQANSSDAPETVAPDAVTPSNYSLTVGPPTEGGSEDGLTNIQMGKSQDGVQSRSRAVSTAESADKAVPAVKEGGSEKAVVAGQVAVQGTLQYWMDSEKAGNLTSSSSSGGVEGAEGHSSDAAAQSTAVTSSLPTYASLGLVSIPSRVPTASTTLEGDVKNRQLSSEIVRGTGAGAAGTVSDGPSSSSTITTKLKQAPAAAHTAANKFVTDPVQMAAIRKQMHVQSLKPPVIKSFTPLSSGRKVRSHTVHRVLSCAIVVHLISVNGSRNHAQTILPYLLFRNSHPSPLISDAFPNMASRCSTRTL